MGETCAFNCDSNGVLIEGIEGSTPPGEAINFAAVVPVVRISANTRNGRSDYLSKMPIDTAYRYRNSAIPGSLYMSKG